MLAWLLIGLHPEPIQVPHLKSLISINSDVIGGSVWIPKDTPITHDTPGISGALCLGTRDKTKCIFFIYHTLMVNCMCQLDWTKDAQIAGKTLFLGMLVRMFWKRVIWIHRLSIEEPTSSCGLASFNPSRASTEQKGRERELSLSSWAGMLILSYPWTLKFLVLGPLDHEIYTSRSLILRPLDINWIIPLIFLVLQLGEGRRAGTSQPPTPHELFCITNLLLYLST